MSPRKSKAANKKPVAKKAIAKKAIAKKAIAKKPIANKPVAKKSSGGSAGAAGYAKMKMGELRQLLKDRGLTPAGRKKADLVAQLNADDDSAAGDEDSFTMVSPFVRSCCCSTVEKNTAHEACTAVGCPCFGWRIFSCSVAWGVVCILTSTLKLLERRTHRSSRTSPRRSECP